jgi:hypothetical protein
MKTNHLITFAISCFMLSSFSHAQNLQFNSAVFYEYGGGQAISNAYTNIVTTGVIVVGVNQVLKVTSAGGSVGLPDSFFPGAYVTINEKTINNLGGPVEIYLPSGTYNVGITDSPTIASTSGGIISYWTGEVKGYISGILYDIVP